MENYGEKTTTRTHGKEKKMSEVTCIFYVVTLVCGFIVGFLTHLLIEADEEAIEILEDIANDEEIEKAD